PAELELGPEVVGHRPAALLVLGVLLDAKGRAAHVESGDRVLGPVGQDDGHHRGEAVDGVGDLALGGAHRREREKGPVDEAVGVDQDQPTAPGGSWYPPILPERWRGERTVDEALRRDLERTI